MNLSVETLLFLRGLLDMVQLSGGAENFETQALAVIKAKRELESELSARALEEPHTGTD